MTEMVTSGSTSGRWRRSYGSLGEGPARKHGSCTRRCRPYCHRATSRLYEHPLLTYERRMDEDPDVGWPSGRVNNLKANPRELTKPQHGALVRLRVARRRLALRVVKVRAGCSTST